MICPHAKNTICDYLVRPDNLDSYVCSGCKHYIPTQVESRPEPPEGRLFAIGIAILIVGAVVFALYALINYLRP